MNLSSAEPDRLSKVRGTEFVSTDTRQQYREKIARITLDSMVQFVGLLDANGTVLEINHAALDAAGISLSDVEGEPLWTTFWWQGSDEISATLRQSIARAAKGEAVRWETPIRGRAGKEPIVVEASLRPVLDDDGNVAFICVEGRDLTEKKALEREIGQKNIELQELRERICELEDIKDGLTAKAGEEGKLNLPGAQAQKSLSEGDLLVRVKNLVELEQTQERHRMLFNSMDEGFCTIEVIFDEKQKPVDYRFLEINQAFEKHTGLRDTRGRTVRELLPNHEQYWFDIYGRVAMTGEPARFEDRAQSLDRWFQVYAFRVGPQENHEVAVYFSDISDRIRAQEALRESDERFRTLADNISQFCWMADAKGWLFWYNRRWFDYTGTTLEEMQGWGWAKVHHPDHVRRVEEKWRRHLEAGESWEDTFPLRGKDGVYRWFLSRAVPIRDETGKIVRWFGTNTDITELREAEAAARSASVAKDNFLAQLSHELRTPLTPVLMTAAALSQEEKLPSEVREQLAMIERNVALEARLIDDLLDLTRVTHGKLALRAEPCDAHSLIALAVEIVRDEAREKQIDIRMGLKAERSRLMGDPARLQQVFWNLLRNAVKFTPRGGHIRIRSSDGVCHSAGKDEHSVCIEVSDDGSGFEPSEAERLFEPFHQGVSSSSPGLGLGLAIARAVVDLHRGKISAMSPGRDQGAIFTVELPATSFGIHPSVTGVDKRLVAQHEETVEPSLRLLVVEDDAPTLQVLSRLLTRAGHQVTTASSIAAARAAAASGKFDVVVSDLGLPDGTGIELMEHLRSAHGLSGIALSGYGMEEDLRRSEEAGFVAHLVKPVDVAELRRMLRRLATQS